MMKSDNPQEATFIGKRIKQERVNRGLSQAELAEAVGKSAAYLSNVENGKTDPPLGLLRLIAAVLQCPVANFFVGADDVATTNGEAMYNSFQPRVVKRDQRKYFVDPSTNSTTWELLSPDTRRKMEFLWVRYEPGAETLESSAHEGEECGLVLSGRLKVTIEETEFILEEGDSIYFQSNRLHGLQNIYDGVTTTVWVITPPSF
jgi:transcriptional regulator with XRE-family HTH domain